MGSMLATVSPAKVFGRPTADQIWLGPAQRRALRFLSAAAPEHTKLLLGPRACGKSTLVDRMLADLENTVYFRSRGSWDSGGALLGGLLDSARLEASADSKAEPHTRFAEHLEHQRRLGRNILIVIDDAERLAPEIWRELYRLRALRLADGYLPEFVLVGRPEVYAWLQTDELGGWESVDMDIHTLPPPDFEQVGSYILNRLEHAFLPKDLFSSAACELVGKLSAGSLRSANLLCQMSLVLADKNAVPNVDQRLVKSARAAIAAKQIPQH